MPGIDSNTKLMVHMNSNFADVSGSGHVPTLGNTPTIDAVTKKFGAGAGKFVGASEQYVSYPDSPDWAFGAGPFTIEAWVYVDSFGVQSDPLIAHQGVDNSNFWVFQIHTGSLGLRFHGEIAGVPFASFNQGATTGWNTSTWYHVALVRNGNDWDLYRDGFSLANTTDSSSMPDFASPLYLSTWFGLATTNNFLSGRLDEYRVSDVARWTTDFTPSAVEYTSDGGGGIIIPRRRREGD